MRTEAVTKTLDRMTKACVASTGVANEWEHKGKRYEFTVSDREHEDGSATGSVFQLPRTDKDKPCGSVRVDPDGSLKRAPKFLLTASLNAELDEVELASADEDSEDSDVEPSVATMLDSASETEVLAASAEPTVETA